MSKEMNEVTVEEILVEAEEVQEEKKGFFTKVKTVGKKIGKPVLAVAGAVTVGVIGYALGKKTGDDSESRYDAIPEIDTDSFSEDVNVTDF